MLVRHCVYVFFVFFFKQKTAYEMRISDWSSDVCSSDLAPRRLAAAGRGAEGLCRQRRIGRARRRAAAASRHALNLHHLFCVHRRCGYTARMTHPTSPRAALRMFAAALVMTPMLAACAGGGGVKKDTRYVARDVSTLYRAAQDRLSPGQADRTSEGEGK